MATHAIDLKAPDVAPPNADPPRLVARRHPGRWVAAAVLAVLAAMAAHSFVTNPRFEWGTVGSYLTADTVLRGLGLTLGLTAATFVAGWLLGIGLAAMRLSSNPVLSAVSFGYVWLVRSIPPLVLLLFWFNLAAIYPTLSLGVPFGPEFVRFDTAHLFGGILAAFVALTLDVAAFAAEIVRGGLLSVPAAQLDSARSLGLSPRRIFRRIVLPQAMPAIVPGAGNLLIGTLKSTSLVSVIAVTDLLYSVQMIYAQNFQVMPLLFVATLWYIVATTVLAVVQFFVERRYARGRAGSGRASWSGTAVLGSALRWRPRLAGGDR
ncbi:amino acid ABC transporter permease [Tsukamurella sp. 8F]|uniref:amino acid ABC transporter permease n=1 Tax=unclassified Tsukamurella TaxID=2633480 RepID=UPI0023BA1CAF|nr:MULTISPECIES: amino acid ABC transporter permease [unclassified Tsukamurella]MDF0530588.1 amino acid ABC transporter permease [Tsukamurella sp. 8J]MDF0586762.1 amino acid ABC transporter permease [Tsukamurella sp. 8F]